MIEGQTSLPGPLMEEVAIVRSEQISPYRDFLRSQPKLVKIQPSDDKTHLHYSAEIGSFNLVRATTDALRSTSSPPYAIDRKNYNGYTPMMLATVQGAHEAAKALLDAGANVNASTEGGQTALDFAVNAGYRQVAKVLRACCSVYSICRCVCPIR